MKFFLGSLFAILVLGIIAVSSAGNASANTSIRVLLDGQEITFADQGPVIVDGRTLVPLRDVFEAIGFTVNWDRDTRTALLNRGDINISIQEGASYFSLAVFNPDMPVGHAVIVPLEVPAQIIGGRTLLPLRAVLESVGYQLVWSDTTRTVYITSQQNIPANERVQDAPIVNVFHLLRGDINGLRDILGSGIAYDTEGMLNMYHFESGLALGVDGTTIMSIWLDYSRVGNNFHFDQISGASTYNDVVARFGNEPHDIGNRADRPSPYEQLGAAFSYGYYLDSAVREFVRFYFDDNNRVVAIHFFS